jgi:hypothetical protein
VAQGGQRPIQAAPVPTGPAADQQAARSRWKKYRVSITLILIAAVLLVITVSLYPSGQELPTPVYSSLTIATLRPVGLIVYTVRQVSTTTAEMEIEVQLPPGSPVPPTDQVVTRLVAYPPIGTSFTTCPAPACKSEPHSISAWNVPLVFEPQSASNGVTATAYAHFFVRAHDFGETYNDVNASVAVPEVMYECLRCTPGTPEFETQYNIPNASSYDWSGFPVQFANTTFATWTEPVTGGLATGRDAVGVDYANQSRDGYYTFLAGVLLGLVGGAVISAIQEALHANDKA